jgi:GMP synthase-like glutamine amidotransferase
MHICCIQHVPFETPGEITTWAQAHQHTYTIVHPYSGEPFPALSGIDMLVVMGGPMGAYEEKYYPWMKDEKKWIEQAIQSGRKLLGVCLGAQLIAHVLGAKVYRHVQKEIGWFPVYAEKIEPGENAYARLFEPYATVFHWHGDTFDLPAGAINHVYSAACRHQLFSWSTHVMGLQFHLEVGQENIQHMLEAGNAEINETISRQPDAQYVQQPHQILTQTSAYASACHQRLHELLHIFTQAY